MPETLRLIKAHRLRTGDRLPPGPCNMGGRLVEVMLFYPAPDNILYQKTIRVETSNGLVSFFDAEEIVRIYR